MSKIGGVIDTKFVQIQLELTLAVKGWLKLALDISWAWISLSVIRSVLKPPGSYWIIVNRVMQVKDCSSSFFLKILNFFEALFSAAMILLGEKVVFHAVSNGTPSDILGQLFLRFVAINFHQKALADRLAENRLGLKALDRLSNAQPAPKKSPYAKRAGRKTPTGSVDFSHLRFNSHGVGDAQQQDKEKEAGSSRSPTKKDSTRRQKRRKAMASIIVDQVSGAIGQVALKNSRFNREGAIGGLESARKLARKLFGALSDVYPPRSHLIVEGPSRTLIFPSVLRVSSRLSPVLPYHCRSCKFLLAAVSWH